jgi:LmbE family N-acetylglucosaminyl deacetylase
MSLNIPSFSERSRLMLIAPHPDDESLACSVILQKALRAGAAVRLIYATDGDNNPWPQRVLERKWRLDESDRRRWGQLRRKEALDALAVLGIRESDTRFLGLPDQGLTELLLLGCQRTLDLFAQTITEWAPTDLLAPATADVHSDHSAVGVILRLVLANLLPPDLQISSWSFLVHGNHARFCENAAVLRQTPKETAIKLAAINCHKTQLILSRTRFFAYADRGEGFLAANGTKGEVNGERNFTSSAKREQPEITFPPVSRRLFPANPRLWIFGYDSTKRFAGAVIPIRTRARSGTAEMYDYKTGRQIAVVTCRGKLLTGLRVALPSDIFSTDHPLYAKVERRGSFFDDFGWIEVQAGEYRLPFAESPIPMVNEVSLAVS